MEEIIVRGLFITFEGPDGSGKTTQLKLLADYLVEKGYKVFTTRDPGGTIISDKIRGILLEPEHEELISQTEILLYASSRAQLVHEVIIPAINQGKIVLCDRYIDASIAYQAYGLGVSQKIVEQINDFASSGLQPTRTYLLNINPEIGINRALKRVNNEFNNKLDRIEQKDIEYHRKVHEGFSKLAREDSNRIVEIDGEKTIDKIFQLIRDDFELFLQLKGGD